MNKKSLKKKRDNIDTFSISNMFTLATFGFMSMMAYFMFASYGFGDFKAPFEVNWWIAFGLYIGYELIFVMYNKKFNDKYKFGDFLGINIILGFLAALSNFIISPLILNGKTLIVWIGSKLIELIKWLIWSVINNYKVILIVFFIIGIKYLLWYFTSRKDRGSRK